MKLAIIIGVVVILFVVFILASYIKAPTDRALIVSGLRKNPKFVIGKSALRIPFLQRVDKLELKMISVDVKTKESVPTNEYINVNIDSAVKIKVGSSKEMLEKAASNFLNKNEDYIRNSVGDVLEGNVREIIGQMRLEDIVQDRKMFAEKVQENAAPDMARMGLEIVSFNVQNVTDEGNVIENLGIDRVVSISKSAQISRAESERDIEVAKANATKQANDARIEAETAISGGLYMVIGFVGLGIMGKPMAKNLCRAGYTLIVNDHHKENVDELVQAGARSGDLKQIGMESDVVITMLPNSPQVKDVMLGENGIAGYMKKGTCFIDMSSINPVDSRYIGDVLKEKGIDMLDAPVSGGEPKAIDGTVAFMVGGDEKTFDKYKQILTHMGSSVTRCGELGAGNTTKLANQIIVACNIQAVSESFILAKKAGVDPERVFEAIKGGLAGSTVMNAKVPMMIEDNVEPGFRVDLHIKDLNNALECAHSVGAPVPMTAQVQEIMQYLHNNGDGSSDHSAIIHYYEKLADTKL